MARIDGILLLDKPLGLTSNNALQRVKRLLGADKAGHTGTLDPLATGMLPICLGEATKVAGYMQLARKEYVTRFTLGTTTATADVEGAVLQSRPVPALDAPLLDAVLATFLGRIRQRAPAYSAIKRDGEPLYARARRGEVVEAPERDVEIFAIERLGFDAASLTVRVLCGSGTYIRSLAVDVGEALGCGGHVAALRRTFVDPFAGQPMRTLEEIAAGDVALCPIDTGLGALPAVALDAHATARLRMGQFVQVQAAEGRETCRVYDEEDRFIAIGQREADGTLRPLRVLADDKRLSVKALPG